MIVTDLKFMLFLLNLKAFGMELLRKRDNPEYKVTSHITANKFQEYFCMPVKFILFYFFNDNPNASAYHHNLVRQHCTSFDWRLLWLISTWTAKFSSINYLYYQPIKKVAVGL